MNTAVTVFFLILRVFSLYFLAVSLFGLCRRRTPDARLLRGLAGFSSKSTIRLFSSVIMIPKRLASSIGTGITAMVTSA